MSRINLDVPYADRQVARRRGARWDAVSRCWFVPTGVDVGPLLGWSCASVSVNARAHSYYLLEKDQHCPHCRSTSRVYGIVLPTGHEVRLLNDDGDDWERSDEPSLIGFVTSLAPSVSHRVRAESGTYQLRYCGGATVSYHLNHCERCASAFEDYALYAEPGRGFEVLSEYEASGIRVTTVASGFAGAAEHFSYGVAFLDSMTRR